MRGVEYTRAKEVKERHEREIERRYPKVVGVGVGAVVDEQDLDEAGGLSYGIHVYLEDAGGLPATPQSIEGVPLKFEVTGPFRLLPEPGPTG